MFLNDLNIRMDVRLKKVNIIYLLIVSIIEIYKRGISHENTGKNNNHRRSDNTGSG